MFLVHLEDDLNPRDHLPRGGAPKTRKDWNPAFRPKISESRVLFGGHFEREAGHGGMFYLLGWLHIYFH